MSSRPLPPLLCAGLNALGFAALFVLERRKPLRLATENERLRDGRNLIIAVIAALPVAFIETPVARHLAMLVERRRLGILKRLHLPLPLETLLAVLLLDYTMYAWHVLAHRAPLLWRFHLVHHSDRDMDVTTALRFHVGEMTLSIPFRALQIALIGVSPLALSVWQTLFTASVLFHHSNLRLPENWEKLLATCVVTPRVHGIHHARNERLQNANWSSGLIVWDKLHGTYVSESRSGGEPIGLPAYRSDRDVAFVAIMTSPFRRQKDTWHG